MDAGVGVIPCIRRMVDGWVYRSARQSWFSAPHSLDAATRTAREGEMMYDGTGSFGSKTQNVLGHSCQSVHGDAGIRNSPVNITINIYSGDAAPGIVDRIIRATLNCLGLRHGARTKRLGTIKNAQELSSDELCRSIDRQLADRRNDRGPR